MTGQESVPTTRDLEAGARNLLLGCVGLKAGERVLLLREDSSHGYYDEAAPAFVAAAAERLGARVRTIMSPLIEGPEDVPAEVTAAMGEADHTLFFSRMGDQLRFLPLPGGGSKTMCYALDAGYLRSGYCPLPHALMQELKHRPEYGLAAASEWRITCPLGTDVSGTFEDLSAEDAAEGDFSLKLFPIVTFRPVSCASMTGRVALDRWLMGTGSRAYEPFALALTAPVFALVESGRIQGFEGDPAEVERVSAHYGWVAAKYGLDRAVVHSWHAGLNPQTFYPRPADSNLERWGGVSFASPRYLHFHTCGDYAPGEIAWSLFDATVTVDGETFWDRGRFVWLERPEIRELVADYPEAVPLMAVREDIGV